MSANERQVGGDHYKNGAQLQHWDYAVRALRNRYLEGCATKYIIRPKKGQAVQDAAKAIHYLDKLIEEARHGRVAPMFDGHLDFGFNVTQWARDVCGFEPESIHRHFLQILASWSSVDDLLVARMLAVRILALLQRAETVAAEPGAGYVKQE